MSRDHDRHERELQRHVLKRIELAKGSRSWNEIAMKSGVSQSTLAGQTGGPSGEPSFSLSVLARIAPVLGRPIGYFFPDDDDEYKRELVALEALRRINALVEWAWREMPEGWKARRGETSRGEDIAERVAPLLPNGETHRESPQSQTNPSSRTPARDKEERPGSKRSPPEKDSGN